MGNQYKLTLSNQTLYREVDLTDDMDSVTPSERRGGAMCVCARSCFLTRLSCS